MKVPKLEVASVQQTVGPLAPLRVTGLATGKGAWKEPLKGGKWVRTSVKATEKKLEERMLWEQEKGHTTNLHENSSCHSKTR